MGGCHSTCGQTKQKKKSEGLGSSVGVGGDDLGAVDAADGGCAGDQGAA
jgi:hypothetical protein